MSNSSQIPRRIGRYDIAGLLATGGMAELFLARQAGPSGFERAVVIKRVLPHLAREADFRDMFVDEARLVVSIRHPNVVQVHELGDDQGELFLVMEYLEGESLAMLAKRQNQRGDRLSDRVVAHTMAEACAGLHAAHELSASGRSLGLVHRDVSPHNLFVLYSGQLKVIDFGIAKAADRTSRTKTGTIKGKFAYMAPEQVRAEEIDRRADVFALGVVMHELLTGKSLFSRDNDLLVMQAVCISPIPSPRDSRPDLDPELERIVMKALARDPDLRYASAAEMRRDLVAVQARLLASAADNTALLPDEELASLMGQLFGDRIASKSGMLQRVREGEALTQVIGIDTGGGIPAGLAPDAPSDSEVTAGPAQMPSIRPAPRRGVALIAGGIALVAVGVTVGVFMGNPGSPTPAAPQGAESLPAVPTAISQAQPSATGEPQASSSPSARAMATAQAIPEASASAPASAALAKPVPPRVPTAKAPNPPPPKSGGFSRFD